MRERPLSTFRRILGNIDFEVELARELAPAGRTRPRARGDGVSRPDPRFTLRAGVLETACAAATLLRAFAAGDDTLWTPAAVDPGRMAPLPGLPLPRLETGPVDKLPASSALLAWGETSAAAALRARCPSGPDAAADAGAKRPDHPPGLPDLWRLPAPSPRAAARVNHRSFCLEVAASLGVALPGAAMLRSVGELEAHVAAGGASASSTGQWVLKAPLSSAARSRLRGRSPRLEAPARRRAERLFALFGSLLFEPWMERTADFACAGIAGPGATVQLLPPHRNDVDPGGNFRGITLAAAEEGGCGLSDLEARQLEETVLAVGSRLLDAGYTGPFTVDCWRHRGREGGSRFHPLGEINARISFGLVARVLAARLVAAGVLPQGRVLRLRFGSRRARADSSESETVVPLVLPSASGQGSAWMETTGGKTSCSTPE